MKIQASVVFPIVVEIDIPDEVVSSFGGEPAGSNYDILEHWRERVKDEAGYILETSAIDPVITDCDSFRALVE